MEYYNGDFTRFLYAPHIIIGKRDSGKTTILKKVVSLFRERFDTIIVFDSATDHKDKSFLVYMKESYDGAEVIESPQKKSICYGTKIFSNAYPYELLKKKQDLSLILFDVSRYLEEGYDTEDLVERERIRMYYKYLVLQELTVMLSFLHGRRAIVLMDEIELIPEMRNVFLEYSKCGIPIIDTLHDDKSIGKLSSLFEVIRL